MEPIPGTSNFFDVSDEEGEDEFENYVPLSRQTLAEEQSSSEESSDRRLDYVPLHNSSIDSDEPLSEYAQRLRVRNSPGTPGFKWRKRENVPRKFGLTATPGLKVNLTQSDSPHEFLNVFFTEETMKIIVEETNKYAESNPGFVRGHERKWTPVTIPELAVYDQISTCLHFSSRMGQIRPNRLWKLGRIVELLQQSFKEAYVPPQTITVDESQDRGVLPASHKAVADLMESAEVLDKGYSLYVDNWYSSPYPIPTGYRGVRPNACGTVRANRKFMPTDFPTECG
ncbi:piggyBac transposable element-derived protein 4-like [Penaeus indicus]|uniref:piggyBac transposable element-derived protein 4-like n=1 Tax=Penaeus indicus TaxID=29960 RepID=UPI00300C3B34